MYWLSFLLRRVAGESFALLFRSIAPIHGLSSLLQAGSVPSSETPDMELKLSFDEFS